jgi:hypothetical protein
MSGKAVGWAREVRCSGGLAAKAVLLLMADFADGDGELFPSVSRMAHELQAAERTVQRAIVSLEQDGLIAREFRSTRSGKSTSSRYRLLINPVAEGCQKVTPSPVTETPSGVSESRGEGVTKSPSTTFEPVLEPRSSDELQTGVREREREAEDREEVSRVAFERVVTAWSAAAPERCSRVKAAPKWAEACEGRDPADVEAACLRYLAEAGEVKRKLCRALDRFLAEAWFENWLPGRTPPDGKPPRPKWSGPAEVRSAVAVLAGEDFAAACVDPSGWDEEGRALIPHTGLAKSRLLDRLRRHLPDLGFSIAERKTAP